MCLLVRSTLTIEMLQRLATGTSTAASAEILEDGERKRLEEQVGAYQSRLRTALVFFHSKGIAPAGLLISRTSPIGSIRGLWDAMLTDISQLHWMWWARNRASDVVYGLARLIVPTTPSIQAGVTAAVRLAWIIRNRLSSVIALVTWCLTGFGIHPIATLILILMVGGAAILPKYANLSPLRAASEELISGPRGLVCQSASSMACPFSSPNARSLCVWTSLPFCSGVTPTPQAPPPATPTSVALSPSATPAPWVITPTPTAASPSTAIPSTAIPSPIPTSSAPVRSPTSRPPNCQDRRVVITSPGINAIVTGKVPIIGTATHRTFAYYKLELGAGSQPEEWSYLDLPDLQRHPVENGLLGTLDLSAPKLPPGTYSIKLTVVDARGDYPPPCQTVILVQ